MLYRIIPGFVAALLATTAISWLFDPTAAAAGLGMPYLEGIDEDAGWRLQRLFCFSGCHVYRRRHYTNWPLPAQRLLAAAAGCGFPALWRGHCTAPSWQRRLLLVKLVMAGLFFSAPPESASKPTLNKALFRLRGYLDHKPVQLLRQSELAG